MFLMILLSWYLALPVRSAKIIYIPKGSTFEIITYLDKNNYDVGLVDALLVGLIGKPQRGWIDIGAT
ncbi:MAG: aminodeoxychorismate lyase, partial [Campylobacterales bacterium]